MADEKEKQERKPARKAATKKAAPKKAAPKAPAAKKAAPKKAAPKKTEAKSEAKGESKASAKPKAPARRRPAAKKAAPKPSAEKKAQAAEAEAPKAKPKPSKAEAPKRPVVHAHAKYVRSSARKARLVMDHVRGRSVAEARALLRHHPRGVARDVERVLNSAIANAENNHDLVGDDLYVKEIYADEGPTLRRFRPRAQGRATRIRKRTSHLTVGLSTKE
jgi:ribosomal protein L22